MMYFADLTEDLSEEALLRIAACTALLAALLVAFVEETLALISKLTDDRVPAAFAELTIALLIARADDQLARFAARIEARAAAFSGWDEDTETERASATVVCATIVSRAARAIIRNRGRDIRKTGVRLHCTFPSKKSEKIGEIFPDP